MKRSAFWRLVELLRPDYGRLAVAMASLILSSASNLAFPYLIGRVLDGAAVPEQSRRRVNVPMLGAAFAVFSVGSVASCLRIYLLSSVKARAATRLRRQLFHNAVAREQRHYDKVKPTQVLGVLSDDVDIAAETATDTLAAGIRSTSSVVNGTLMLFSLSPELTLVSMAIVPVVGLSSMGFAKAAQQHTTALRESQTRTQAYLVERLALLSTIRLFAREKHEAEAYSAKVNGDLACSNRVALANGLFRGMLFFSLNAALVSVLAVGGQLVAKQKLTMGKLTSFAMYSSFVGLGFSGLSQFYSNARQGMVSARRVFDELDTESIELDAGIDVETSAVGHIKFDHVTFSYPSRREQPVLRGVSFSIKQGEYLALTGPSGSGKSTIAALLSRVYTLDHDAGDEGCIYVDHMPVHDVSPRWLREQIGVVEQDPVLFHDTIANNIRYGKLDATTEEVVAAAKVANAHDFIVGLPQGYHTPVGDRGAQLSGGQRQRIAIARAVIKDPPLLILDEAQSSLDMESERLVREALERVRRNRTVLVIAHRKETLESASRIVVVQDGKVCESGTFDSLSKDKSSAFWRIYKTGNL